MKIKKLLQELPIVIIGLLLGINVGSGAHFLWTHDRVTLGWNASSDDDISHHVIYLGSESRYASWEGSRSEKLYYTLERSIASKRKLEKAIEELKRATSNSGSVRKLINELEAAKLIGQGEEESLYAVLAPYSREINVGKKTQIKIWVRCGQKYYAAVRTFDTAGNGSWFSEEIMIRTATPKSDITNWNEWY